MRRLTGWRYIDWLRYKRAYHWHLRNRRYHFYEFLCSLAGEDSLATVHDEIGTPRRRGDVSENNL